MQVSAAPGEAKAHLEAGLTLLKGMGGLALVCSWEWRKQQMGQGSGCQDGRCPQCGLQIPPLCTCHLPIHPRRHWSLPPILETSHEGTRRSHI